MQPGPPVVVEWTRLDVEAHVDDILEVYAEAMQATRADASGRRSVLVSHLSRRGLRAMAALDGSRLVGVAYGYLGGPGQWWHDQVQAAMSVEAAQEWLADAFEVCELHVRPAQQGSGVGKRLLDQLLDGADAKTAVLSTPDHETRARAFYRAGGWEDLVRDLHFPGDPRSFAVLGRRL